MAGRRSVVNGSGDRFGEDERKKYHQCKPKFDDFVSDALSRRLAELQKEMINTDESVSESEATGNGASPEGEMSEMELTLETDDGEDISDGSTALRASTALQSDSGHPAGKNESPLEPEGEQDAGGEKDSKEELEVERKSIQNETKIDQKADCIEKLYVKSAPSTSNDIIFTKPSVENELNETYQRLFAAMSVVDELKKSIEKYKDPTFTKEDAKELKEKEKLLFEKLSELECVTQKLMELGGIPVSECDISLFAPDMGAGMLSSDDKYFNDLKKCIGGSDMGDRFEKPKLGMMCGDKTYKRASVIAPKDIKKSYNIPQDSSFLSKAFELPKVIMCHTDKNLPKIVLGDQKKKLNIAEGQPKWPLPSIDASMDPKNEVVICLADRLNDSSSLQDKLAAENVHLEDFQYQLLEDILSKEQALDHLKRENSLIINEMKLLEWENKQLQEKLCNQNKQPSKVSCKKDQSKKMEENMINRLEMQMKSMQRELECVQMARKQAEGERCKLQEAASSMRNRPTTCPLQMNQDKNCEKIQQLKEKYSRVTEDYKAKVTEVAAMHVENENLIIELEEKRRCMKEAETTIKELQDKLVAADAEKENTRGSKGQSSQVMVLEQQLRDAKDELEELHMMQQECAYQKEYYREKYLLAQQQVEEQCRQIEVMEEDNRRMTKQVEEEIQRVKCQFREKVEELKSLPDVLRTTQCRLQEAIQKQKAAEEKCYEFQLEAEDTRAKMIEATQKLDQYWNQQQDSINQADSLTAKVEAWEKKCKELTDCNCKLKGEMKRLEECAAQCRRCSEEKSVEILQLSNQLECVREDSARQVAKAKERCETVRRSYQCQIEDIKRQLAQTRACARIAQAKRDECQFREKVEELKSLPDVLRTTQCRLQEAIQKQKAAEEKCYEFQLEAEDTRAKMIEATQKLDQYWNQQQDSINQADSLTAKAEAWEKKCKELTDCNCKLKGEMKRLEECAAQCRRCSEEKSVEILQLSNQLECVREDSARQVAKAKERCETVRRSYQCQIEDIRRQLAQTRACARIAQARRDECQFREKVEELKSLPDVLRTTQCRLQEAIQKQKAAEEKCYEFQLEAEDTRAKMIEATQKLDQYWNQQQDSINQADSLTAKAEAWEKKCKELTDCNCKLKGEMKRLEECAAQCRRCSEEKSVEILQLSNQLECVREDSARQVAKAKERCETVRRSYQCQIEDIRRQLAQTRACARIAQARRDETRKRMPCEVGNLSEKFEQTQSRIRYHKSHVNHQKSSFSNM